MLYFLFLFEIPLLRLSSDEDDVDEVAADVSRGHHEEDHAPGGGRHIPMGDGT